MIARHLSPRNPYLFRLRRWAAREQAAELRRRTVLALLTVGRDLDLDLLERRYWLAHDRAERARLEMALAKHQARDWEIRQW